MLYVKRFTPSSIVFRVLRTIQHQAPIRKPADRYPTQNRKPKFDSAQFEETLRPSAEDITIENQHEKLSDFILPLANYPYDEQLKIKQDLLEQSFEQIGRAILWDKGIDERVLKHVEFKQGQFCHVQPIIPSPTIDHYRCRDDLSCGYGVDGQKTIGFYINSRNAKKFANTLCIPPLHLKSMKPKHRLTVKHFDLFLKQHPLSVCENTNILKKDQYWRSMILKSNDQNHLMMIVVVHPQSSSKIELDQMKKDLLDYFLNGPGHECELNSIYFQTCAYNRCTSEQSPFELIHGEKYIFETYNGRQFRISPESFLQANKKAAELIYSSTIEQAKIDENTIVLDIGSGLGVYSVMASFLAKKVYAIEPSQLNVEDGKANAKLNESQDNFEWISGFAEAHLHRILKKIGDLHGDNARIVAIVNPSRYSLTTKATVILRSLPTIERILYVSSKPDEQAMHNFYQLAAGERSSVQSLGKPLVPTCIYPVDLLPHTIQSEIVVECVRV